MATTSLRRLRRSGRVSPEQAAKDMAVRRKVRAEFPPRQAEPLGEPLSEALKAALRGSELTAYEIAKRAGISQIIISRFLSDERDIRLATADKLAHALGLTRIPAWMDGAGGRILPPNTRPSRPDAAQGDGHRVPSRRFLHLREDPCEGGRCPARILPEARKPPGGARRAEGDTAGPRCVGRWARPTPHSPGEA